MKHLFYLGLLLSLPVGAQSAAPSGASCQPCSLQPGKDQPIFSVTLHDSAQRERASELIVTREGREVQRLKIHDAGPLREDQASSFLTADLNFDGLLDLEVVTSQGVANAYSDDWLYDPLEKHFTYLGNYPVFTPDPTHRTLKTYERNGEGGMAYSAKVYTLAGNRLQLVRSEVQVETGRANVFRQTVQERVQGVLKVTSRKLVRVPGSR